MPHGEFHTHCGLDDNRSVSHVLEPFSAKFSADNLLNRACSIEKLVGTQSFDPIEGFATEENLGLSELQAGYCTPGLEIKS